EINRILKPGGICYFAAGNRLIWKEPDNNLPLLSVLPKWIGTYYLRLVRGHDYYETFRTVWGLRRLVQDFEVVDYTASILAAPKKFEAEDLVTQGTLKQKLALFLARYGYALFPTYIWLLRKKRAR